MKKLAIITTHPIQYNAPLFKLLTGRDNIITHVFYTWGQAVDDDKFDPGFGQNVAWDIDLLSGYSYTAVRNSAKAPGSHHYNGIDNPDLINSINAYDPDAVLVYGWRFKSHWKAIRYFHEKIPVFFRGDSTLLDEVPGVKKILRRVALQYIYRRVDKALYAGIANKDYFLAHGLKAEQLIFMPHTVDNARFHLNAQLAEAASALRAHHDIPKEACVFLFVGKLDNNKRPEILAALLSAQDLNGAFLIFAGSGPLEASMRKTFANNKNIIFFGFVNQLQMPTLYHACDVLVLPSKAETWGLCINEAMAAGKAIIASDGCGAVYNLISKEVNGFIFAKNNLESLHLHLQFCIKHPHIVKQMGKKSVKIINDYSLENSCIVLETAINDCKTL